MKSKIDERTTMKLSYSDVTTDLPSSVYSHLIAYGHAVCRAMQAADKDHPECWTWFSWHVADNGLDPEFQYGAAESDVTDADWSEPVYVPLLKKGPQ